MLKICFFIFNKKQTLSRELTCKFAGQILLCQYLNLFHYNTFGSFLLHCSNVLCSSTCKPHDWLWLPRVPVTFIHWWQMQHITCHQQWFTSSVLPRTLLASSLPGQPCYQPGRSRCLDLPASAAPSPRPWLSQTSPGQIKPPGQFPSRLSPD